MKKIEQIKPNLGIAEAEAVHKYIMSGGWGTEYKKTEEFEQAICKFLEAPFCVCVNNGTQALILSLLAAGIKPGDEVIVPGLSMIATANAVRFIGAKPVFVDVDQIGCLDIEELDKNITKLTKAVIHVSLNGRANDMGWIWAKCDAANIPLIEDACQAFGSKCINRPLGLFGEFGCFSFSPHKIITTGQGGCIVCKTEANYLKLKRLKDFGREKGGADYHEYFGINCKFTDIQAVIGIEQLKKVKFFISRKQHIYNEYLKQLVPWMISLNKETVPWFVDIYLDNKGDLHQFLLENDIETRAMYPPMYRQPIYNENMRLRNTELISRRGLWLPSSISLQDDEIEYICEKIKTFTKE